MAVIRLTQVIQRPIEEVFATVADAGRFHEWNPTIRRARQITDGEVGLGSKFEWDLRGFGTVVQEFGEFEKPARIRIVPHIRQLRGGHLFLFSRKASATRIDHELEMRPAGWFRLFAPMMGVMGRKNLRDTARALQQYLEKPGIGR
jgi:hypothetical protein